MFVRTGFFGGVALCFSLSDRSCDIRKVGADGKTFVKQVRRADSHLGKPSFSLKKRGNGASIIASQKAIDHIKNVFPEDKTTIWCAAIDPEINEHSYIVPGLGDAGDLAYGEKE